MGLPGKPDNQAPQVNQHKDSDHLTCLPGELINARTQDATPHQTAFKPDPKPNAGSLAPNTIYGAGRLAYACDLLPFPITSPTNRHP